MTHAATYTASPLLHLLRSFSLAELRHHPLRHATALLAVMLGVALAFSVHLINQSALSEFSAAVRSVNGEPDFELRSAQGGFEETLYARVAAHPRVAHASPVIEVETYALDAAGKRVPLRVIGLDALVAGPLSPALVPALDQARDRMELFSPDAISLNPAARQRLGIAPGGKLRVQAGLGWVELLVVGSVSAPGGPLAVQDIAGTQSHFQRLGQLSRIDVRLVSGADAAQVLRELALPIGVRAVAPDQAMQRVSNLSRAYRVNLTVLALVALFTGAFLVFSILSLSVAKRFQQFALLGVLGLTARQRLALVLCESAAMGWWAACLALFSAPCWRASRCGSWAATWAVATSPASRRRCISPGPPRWCMAASAWRPRWSADGCRRAPRSASNPRWRSRGWVKCGGMAGSAAASAWCCSPRAA